ncbi:pyridoxal-phosphate dependent enzyme [Gallaecimonas sp. GXIMD4217]|uniref:pyridoxal-phosphate dependent enzyme n=1 Tax=Gallaecimonas sp. GXIMD4217 TaxID=3131927 RepID=UPI00311B2988
MLMLEQLPAPYLAPTLRTLEHPEWGRLTLLDESRNHSGTHKDRMAIAIASAYQAMLVQNPALRLSIISSGSAAYAIQSLFNRLGMPPLKVLIDRLRPEAALLDDLGCQVYRCDLGARMLTPSDILALTDNPAGIEVTSNMAIRPYESYYRDMVAELAHFGPGYIFVPFGTGHLYGSFLSCRAFRDASAVHVIGGATQCPDSRADKLYAPFNPFCVVNDNFIKTKIALGEIGARSRVHGFSEAALDRALLLADELGLDVEPSALGGLAAMIDLHGQGQLPAAAHRLAVLTGKSAVYRQLQAAL